VKKDNEMKTMITIKVVLAAMFMAGTVEAQEFYYGTDGPITMLRDSTKVLLKFDPSSRSSIRMPSWILLDG
jgi:hypothetical protein